MLGKSRITFKKKIMFTSSMYWHTVFLSYSLDVGIVPHHILFFTHFFLFTYSMHWYTVSLLFQADENSNLTTSISYFRSVLPILTGGKTWFLLLHDGSILLARIDQWRYVSTPSNTTIYF
jgi:hypothetical protein